MSNLDDFEEELARLINRHSLENGCNMPDHVIANYLRVAYESLCSATDHIVDWSMRIRWQTLDVEQVLNEQSEAIKKLQERLEKPTDATDHIVDWDKKSNVIDEVLDAAAGLPPNTHDPETGEPLGTERYSGGTWKAMIEHTLRTQRNQIEKLQRQLEKPSGVKVHNHGMREGTAYNHPPVQTSPGHWEVPD